VPTVQSSDRLLAIIDKGSCSSRSLDPSRLAAELATAGVRRFWYRNRVDNPEIAGSELSEIVAALTTWPCQIVASEGIDDHSVQGIHLRSTGVAVRTVRQQSDDRIIGMSCHTLYEAQRAANEGADYVTVSPVFQTISKPLDGRSPLGLTRLREITRQVSAPVFALGGVDAENVTACLNSGASGVAVLGTLSSAASPGAAAAQLLARITRWSLVLLLTLSFACDNQPIDNDPPAVPRQPRVHRTELGQFHVEWDATPDDHTDESQIRYEVGLITSDVCVVIEPGFTVTGATELDTTVWTEVGDGPFVGFTLRSLDGDGFSHGYGQCGWALRSPQRVPMSFYDRTPHIPPSRLNGNEPVCRPDGGQGAWCLGEGELSHFGHRRWDVFALPPGLRPEHWTPIDAYDALIGSESIQIHFSRANGIHAYTLGSGNEHFEGTGGAIGTGRERGYLVVRGFVGEFTTGHVDLAGPPMAAQLPPACERLIQLGGSDDAAFALCRSHDGNLLFVGDRERRVFRWADPCEVDADRVDGFVGSPSRGLFGVTTANAGSIVTCEEGEAEVVDLPALPGSGRPIIAVGGPIDHLLVLAGRADELYRLDGSAWVELFGDASGFQWGDAWIPRSSHLVGTTNGVLAIGPDTVVHLGPTGGELIRNQSTGFLGHRGQDSRHYLVSGPDLRRVYSSRAGDEWFEHPWNGPAMRPVSLAVTTSGGIFLSGWVLDRPFVARLGDEEAELTPTEPLSTPPLLVADSQNNLFAFAQNRAYSVHRPSNRLVEGDLLPGPATVAVGLDRGAVVSVERNGGNVLFRCSDEGCEPFDLPDAEPFTTLLSRHEGGFCAGRTRSLWCRLDTDIDIPVVFSDAVATRYRLRGSDDWSIVDAIVVRNGAWLLAIQARDQGYLATVHAGEPAALVAEGFHFGAGEVLRSGLESGMTYVIERGGPVRLQLQGRRLSVPGVLY
jgi:thiamine-phosphate pyrophosphorylase